MCSIIRAMTDNAPAVHVQPDGGAAWAPCYGSAVRLTGAGAIGCEGASLRARHTVCTTDYWLWDLQHGFTEDPLH